MQKKTRVQCFVDGFNLYHAIHNLNKPHLKWFDLRKLVEVFIDPNQHELHEVYYFSAYATWLSGPFERHKHYTNAIQALGSTPIMGQFKRKDRECKNCDRRWIAHEEKETDVNIALGLVRGAYQDTYDEAFLISRDSDLAPAVRLVYDQFPNKKVKIITPPASRHCKEIAAIVGKNKLASIKPIHLERSLMPKEVIDSHTKQVIAKRPIEYQPPTSH